MKRFSLFFLYYISWLAAIPQELYPSTEPASTLPKKLFSARFSYQQYQEPMGRSKNWTGIRLMYGLTRSTTLIGTISASNHHLKTYPGNLFDYFKNHHNRSYPAFPFLLEGFHVYAKQRIFNVDRQKKHFRVAVYGEFSKVFTVHDNAEPNLMGDNSGFGGGVILTKLINKWALSFTGGYTHPLMYKDSVVTFSSGNMYSFSLSAGYRIYPKTYTGYDDLNVNIYAEIFNRHYSAAAVTYRNLLIENTRFLPDDRNTYNSLIANNYMEIRPAIQFILSSSTRIDVGAALPLYKKSYLYYYPQVFINFQKYFYSKK